ncbi:Rieske (2Fe-2S) protein [Methylobacterium sp. CB376]|uniref:Rieske (2Fe-2S) protein n=1 Tax=Methylobacterium sp. CB376 TaxID=3138063 RepID=UPI0003217299|nr:MULTISPECIES: Rieske (2Fe-2S) protein [Methylobacterium]WFT79165.1 Rieske (2Fe-2S) protein [Methylobacterium nodulans]
MPSRPGEAGAGAQRWVRACRLDEAEAGPIVPVLVGGRHLVLVRDGATIVAAERACPHEGADLARGRCANGRLLCPHHRASFDLRDGQVSAGWPTRPLRLYPVEIRNAEVFVDASDLVQG